MKHFLRSLMIPAVLAIASTPAFAGEEINAMKAAATETAKETVKETVITTSKEVVKDTAAEGAAEAVTTQPTAGSAVDAAKEAVTKKADEAVKAVKEEAVGYKSITAEELQTLIAENKDLVIIDSRGGKWFDGEVIAGAKNLPADKTNKKTLAKLLKTKATPVVFYCSSTECPASASAAHAAVKAGYTNVSKLPGGIAEWKEKGLPTAKLK